MLMKKPDKVFRINENKEWYGWFRLRNWIEVVQLWVKLKSSNHEIGVRESDEEVEIRN